MNVWIKGLLNAIVSGAATAGSSWMALAAAKSAGFTVPDLNFKALTAILITGSLTNLFSYLRNSPLFQSQVISREVTTTTESKGSV